MIAKQVMQNTIEGLAAIAHVDLRVLDTDGRLIVSAPAAGKDAPADEERTVREFVNSPADAQEIGGDQYFKIFDGEQLVYILRVAGGEENAHMLGKMVAFQLSGLAVAYRERFDRDNFVKNLLLDNLLLVDIYSRARKLRIAENVGRACMVIRPEKERDAGTIEMIRGMIGSGRGFVTEIDENDVIIVREFPETEEESGEEAEIAAAQTLKEEAGALLEKLTAEGFADLRISCGTVVRDLKDVSRSFKEAKMALEVSRIFYENERVICYSELGIGRLIYQLPLPLCRMFLSETFGECRPERDIDQEIIDTVDVFFENSLNVSETSRKLFIHRNTLVYRLDKLQKITGLDVRVFEDAMTYRIAMMVVRYMKYMEDISY
ncbi:MAG: helix-turn-helix domain-containing protein [Lachnospiraceae bacterium]|nr:helix-turn-helix domain-containing protein [Lachnospiraceae bacterium]